MLSTQKRYESVITELESRVYKTGINYSLENFQNTLTFFQSPHELSSKIIHVAGTNGKGSSIAFLEAALIECGLSVATFTSPHIESYTERFRLNGQQINQMEFIEHFDTIQRIEKDYPELEISTEFEALTLMAFLFFKKHTPHFILLEVGLGGRLDATNVVTPTLSIITSIGFDHQAILGNSIREIATEKAGIIKAGIPVISAVQTADASIVIRQKAHSENAELTVCEPHSEIPKTYTLTGSYQQQNLALAKTAIEKLLPYALQENAERGFQKAKNWGRYTIIKRQNQSIIIDAGHNIDGIIATQNAIKNDFPNQPLSIVMGFAKHKNGQDMLAYLERISAHRYYVEFDDHFATPFTQIQEWASAPIENIRTLNAETFPNEPLVLVTGSIYFLGSVKTVLESL